MEKLTAKEKAIDLIVSMSFCLTEHPTPHINVAKQCALIAVDEIINSNPCCESSDRGGNFMWQDNVYYWQEVRQEIEKL